MFKMIACTSTGGDCTCGYNVILDREYTVEDFVNTILTEKNNEWGNIDIYNYRCEYNNGKLITKTFPEEYLQKKVTKVSASGGWTRMDYVLKIK